MVDVGERNLNFGQAIVEAIADEFRRDESVFMIGEDITHGVYIDYSMLVEKFRERLVSTPICEETVVGSALGAALTGSRPIVDLHFNDFMLRAMDQIINELSKIQYVTGGQVGLPIVIRTMINTGVNTMGVNHSQNFSPLFMHTPGVQIAIPSTPYDAMGLLKTAIRGNNPVLFFEHAALYRSAGSVPTEDFTIPFGKGLVRRQGKHVTIVADMYMQHIALDCVSALEERGIEPEIVDLRTLVPLDKSTIFESIKKTRRLVTAEQGPKTGGMGAEISAIVSEECFDYLEAPIKRVAAKDFPVPASRRLQSAVLPNEQQLISVVEECVERNN